jgi:hypothetical protein
MTDTNNLQQQEVTMQNQGVTPRNPVAASFGSTDVVRHQVHANKRRDRMVNRRNWRREVEFDG